MPPRFPSPWASGWGEDACGLWQALSVNGIRQLFRWIRPGVFLMGAPPEESAGLFLAGKETRHEVTLPQGFWLAETAVTQALWLAVMKSNPSGFLGPQRPVERVSWQMVQQFLRRLSSLQPGLAARLPMEAEWEYACRAGSHAPFCFGETIGPEQVNCNCGKGSEISCRRQTVPVKSLPANAWGLHEMHGNVWEWCQDGWRLDLQEIEPPAPPAINQFRVVRGGSWACRAAYVRSACRDRYDADFGAGSIGFRLAA